MNIRKTTPRSKKAAAITVALLLVALLAAGTYAYAYQIGPFAYLKQQATEDAANSSDATNPRQKVDTPSQEATKGTGADKTTDQIPVAPQGEIAITNLTQQDGNVTYTASLSGVDLTGTCSALFEHADGAARPITQTTQANETGCPETSIPEMNFSARGTWTLTLRYFVNDTQLLTTKTFEVN